MTEYHIINGIGSENSELFIIGEKPSQEDFIWNKPFSDIVGCYFKKILQNSNFNPYSTYMTYAIKNLKEKNPQKNILWSELKKINPKVIITLGTIPTGLILRLPKNFKLQKYIGKLHTVDYINSKIYCWYSPNYLFQRGKSLENKTLEFFKEIRKNL